MKDDFVKMAEFATSLKVIVAGWAVSGVALLSHVDSLFVSITAILVAIAAFWNAKKRRIETKIAAAELAELQQKLNDKDKS